MTLSAGADSEKPPRKSRSGSDGEALERAACRNRSRSGSGSACFRETGSPSGESRVWSGSVPGSREDLRCDTSTRYPSPADSRGDAPGGWYSPSEGPSPLHHIMLDRFPPSGRRGPRRAPPRGPGVGPRAAEPGAPERGRGLTDAADGWRPAATARRTDGARRIAWPGRARARCPAHLRRALGCPADGDLHESRPIG
jgi:hypothetical protein